MNTTVTASNMQVKAVAEQGILINEVASASDEHWDGEATTNQSNPGHQLRATSTANTKTWYVAYSTKSSSAAQATSGTKSGDLTAAGYTALSATASTVQAAAAGTSAKQDVFYVDRDADSAYDDGEGYYVKYTYYLKSSANAITLGTAQNDQNLNIKSVTASPSGTATDLDKALRVAVVIGGKAYIFAPVSGATTSYFVNAATTATIALTSGSQATALTSLPASTSDGTPVEIYLYFEGEDVNLKTDNLTTTLNNMTVAVTFELVTNSSAVTDNGVTVPTT